MTAELFLVKRRLPIDDIVCDDDNKIAEIPNDLRRLDINNPRLGNFGITPVGDGGSFRIELVDHRQVVEISPHPKFGIGVARIPGVEQDFVLIPGPERKIK